MQDGTLWFNTWKVCALIPSMVYGLLGSKKIKIDDDWSGEDNTKLKHLEVAGGVKRKSQRKELKKEQINRIVACTKYLFKLSLLDSKGQPVLSLIGIY